MILALIEMRSLKLPCFFALSACVLACTRLCAQTSSALRPQGVITEEY
jgi:hypothetical protein